MILFGLSGITHPLMSWFGPQAAAFFPPQGQFAPQDIAAIPQTLASSGLQQAQLVKVLPTAEGNLLQITLHNGTDRRYFNLADGTEYPGFDRKQGEWLARYYTGLADTPIRAMHLQTHFDDAYPAVNRLLPVWRVDFATHDKLTAFVHTELNALASLSNDTKNLQQKLFQTLHTWSWLDSLEPVRVAILLVLVASLAAMCLTGLILTLAMPSRKLKGQRRWHRALAWGLWLPLLAFATSGLYHLLHNAGDAGPQGLVYGKPITFGNQALGAVANSVAAIENQALNSITLIAGPEGQTLYRLGEPTGKPGQHVGHHGRFDGTATEKPARLIVAATGQPSALDDESLARFAAAGHLGIAQQQIESSAIVTHFGPDYDFRNKRLPVWRINHPAGTAFIDPVNGALVDSVNKADLFEGLSFSHLHKWNFLTPVTGRQIRDGLMVLVMVITLGFTWLGFTMLLRRRAG